MAFIERKDPIVLNIKLTSKGRELLSSGQLDFKYYALGDSEVDYNFNREVVADPNVSGYTAFDSTILRAADKNANPISFIPKNLSGDPYIEMSSVPSTAYQVENSVESLGFFTDNNTKYITDSNHVKQPDCYIKMEEVDGQGDPGDGITLYKASTYGTSGEEPAVGDILFVKWTYYDNTTGFDVEKTTPKPHLFYRITWVDPNSTLASGSVGIKVDRRLPYFSDNGGVVGVEAGAMIYYNEINFSGDTILSMSPTDYLDESVLSFLENNQCPTIVFPYWNLSVIFTEEIAGVQASNLKYTQFKDRSLGGFVSYIQNQAPILKKLGVIHYTNSSPANVYGESFLQDTPTVDIPTIMWHKSPTATLGTTLSPLGGQKLLAGLNLYYYDLADSEGFVVGKMFSDLKIFVIEDQELLFAMSYKSNRSWTVPDYIAAKGGIVSQTPSVTGGTNVTWTTPFNDTYESVVGTCTSCIISQEYCHSASANWISFPVGTSVSCGNICDAGYRVCGCNKVGAPYFYGGGISICARDIVNNCNIVATGAGGPPEYKWLATLSNVNDPDGIIFCGCITN